jgi:hypothetical protein
VFRHHKYHSAGLQSQKPLSYQGVSVWIFGGYTDVLIVTVPEGEEWKGGDIVSPGLVWQGGLQAVMLPC